MEQFVEAALNYLNQVLETVGRPATLQQLGIIMLLYIPALLLGRSFEPRLEVWARKIRGMKRLLRLVVGFLRRLRFCPAHGWSLPSYRTRFAVAPSAACLQSPYGCLLP